MMFIQDGPVDIATRNGKRLEVVEYFKYLLVVTWMESSEKYFEIRKALAWSSCHKLKKIWNTTLSRKIKERLFIDHHQGIGEENERMLHKDAAHES